MVRRALISVYDKSGLEDLVKVLDAFGFEIFSSGGTAKRMRELGFGRLTEVSDYTGFPESPGGLLKTLHPKVHGGLLLNWNVPEHRIYMERHNIKSFNLVVVNLYPFEAMVAKGAAIETAAENIDIGGPTMIRSAAKAALLYKNVAVVTDPAQYPEVIDALNRHNGEIPGGLIRDLAINAFKRTSTYDSAIVSYLEEERK